MRMTITTTFDEEKLTGKKTVNCSGCGKKLARSKVFSQTINPWNKTQDGRVKTRADIRTELSAEIKEWKLQPEICKACEAEKEAKR